MVTDLADLVAWLPAGSALWMAVGGPAALTAEAHELRAIEFRLRELGWMKSKDAQSGRNRPKPPDPVPFAHERRAEDVVMSRKSEAHLRRQAMRGASEVG